MRVVDISQFEGALVIHFDTEGDRINAYTLASTLVGFADAAKAANSAINFGYDIEIIVESIGPGSFRTKIRAVYAKARNLFSDQRVQAVILSIIANFIYERALSVDDSVKVEVRTDEVVIERADDRIVVPRQVYDATRNVEKSPPFLRAIARTLESVGADEKVLGLGFVADMKSPPPEVVISRDAILNSAITVGDDPLTRVIHEQCDLQIVKAILDRTHRKWEFMWRGVKISAPVTDDSFYSRFFAHDITIAPGDDLKVKLAIKQSRDPMTGIYTNVSYEVIEVFDHIPGIRQMSLANRNDGD